MQTITPFLWYNGRVEEAAIFYTTVFKNSKLVSSNPGSAVVELNGQQLILFNGGPMFKFNESFSLTINCETQEEIDYYWEKLIGDEGEESRCGWLKDQFGLSWQVVPPVLVKLLSDKDREKAGKAMQAMLKMNKLIIADLQKAFDGE